MKTRLPLFLGLAAIIACIAFSSCADLAGTVLSFDDEGNATFTAPSRPLVIPAK